MVLGLREITNVKDIRKEQRSRPSSNRNWRDVGTSDANSNWNSFSSCEKRTTKEKEPKGKEPKEPQATRRKVSKDSKDGSPAEKKRVQVASPALASTGKGAYVPPHLRGKKGEQRRAARTSAIAIARGSSPPKSRKSKKPSKSPSQQSPRVMVCGPLLGVAVEIFEKAHGLNGRQKEELEALKVETMAKYNCSERAFQSLVLGHSYDEVLAPLRKQVPGYVTKEEARRKKQQLARKAREAAANESKSCQSSPSTINPISPASTMNIGHDLLVLNNPFEIPDSVTNTPELEFSDYFSDSSTGGTPPPERRKNVRRKPRSHTEPTLDTSRLALAFKRSGLYDTTTTTTEEKDTEEKDTEEKVLSDTNDVASIFGSVSAVLFSALSTSG
jgi:hypothetical protein